MTRLGWALLLGLLVSGCATTRTVRLETDDGARVAVTPREEEGASLSTARLKEAEFKQAVKTLARDVRPSAHPMRAARELFGLPERSGLYGFQERTRRIVPLGEEETRDLHLLDASDDLTRGYKRWCESRKQAGDCLRLLEEGPLLGSDGRYALAMAVAMDSVWQETSEDLKDPENIVEVPGHRGPHPQEYHQLVHDRLRQATLTCRSVLSCRNALTSSLRELAAEARTHGTELNRLLTQGH